MRHPVSNNLQNSCLNQPIYLCFSSMAMLYQIFDMHEPNHMMKKTHTERHEFELNYLFRCTMTISETKGKKQSNVSLI